MTAAGPDDVALKTKHRGMWASGNYSAVATTLIPELGERIVAALDIRPGDTVLDVAAGSGNAAIPAALAGATVTASDLTPELLEIGSKLAADRGAVLDWQEADAERLPFADGAFDKVMSVVGVMFAPHHQAAADELVRVTKPGGTIGLISWTPEGFIGQMFAVMKPYAPPPPPGASPAPLWGSEEHVRTLLGDRVTDVQAEKQTVRISQFKNGEEFRDYFKANYGPTISTYKFLADDTEKVAALDQALAEHGNRYDLGEGVMDWEYLLVTAKKP